MRGTIALDIDGTITADSKTHSIPLQVVEYLQRLSKSGWQLVFITGRSFDASLKTLKLIPFEYYLAVQNGALILHMPSRHVIAKKYLDNSVFAEMELICAGFPSDFTVYGGLEEEGVVYYRPKKFSKELLSYLSERTKGFGEVWHPLECFGELPIASFPSLKCFGSYTSAFELSSRIEARLGLHAPPIKDPFDSSYYVIQATHGSTSKGQALKDLLAYLGHFGKIIAAGDDLNDLPMLQAADIKIAMEGAPEKLLAIADIIAEPAREFGIIRALNQAITSP